MNEQAVNVYDISITNPNALPEKRCYTVEELQIILSVSRPTVYNLIKKNEFRSFQIGGGKWRISKKSFDEWLDTKMSRSVCESTEEGKIAHL